MQQQGRGGRGGVVYALPAAPGDTEAFIPAQPDVMALHGGLALYMQGYESGYADGFVDGQAFEGMQRENGSGL